MPEDDLRQTMMLHESEICDFEDAWHLGDYGDGWGIYAVRTDDPAAELSIKSAARRNSWVAGRRHRRLTVGSWP